MEAPFLHRIKRVIATFYLNSDFFSELHEINLQLRVIKSELWDIQLRFWIFFLQVYTS